jgi:hypothetical protein
VSSDVPLPDARRFLASLARSIFDTRRIATSLRASASPVKGAQRADLVEQWMHPCSRASSDGSGQASPTRRSSVVLVKAARCRPSGSRGQAAVLHSSSFPCLLSRAIVQLVKHLSHSTPSCYPARADTCAARCCSRRSRLDTRVLSVRPSPLPHWLGPHLPWATHFEPSDLELPRNKTLFSIHHEHHRWPANFINLPYTRRPFFGPSTVIKSRSTPPTIPKA